MHKTYSKNDLMKLAIEEHLKCSEFPRVGAVVARDGRVLSTGYRGEVRGVHAERIALEKLCHAERQGSTIYTTLEPCVKLNQDQAIESCAELIISSDVSEVVIGVLDPNGTIYSQGFRTLLKSNVSVSFFTRKLREAVEEETFEFSDFHRVYSSGKRRVPVVNSGININVQFSESDTRTIPISWASLQHSHGCVDLSSSAGAITIAAGATNLSDITDPSVFRFPSHFARMKKGMIAIVRPTGESFCVLIKLNELFENDILFQWEVRNFI